MDAAILAKKPMIYIIPLISGYILDLALHDPYWLPHPVRIFGKVISYSDHLLNRNKNKRLKGSLATLILISIVWVLICSIVMISEKTPYLYIFVASILIFYTIANAGLTFEAMKVYHILTTKGIKEGRKQLSFIVGRDTSELTENKIKIAILETLSENLNDGVIAPLFYYALGGLPLMLAYKMVNTLDSMIGYKNKKYKDFGYFAAKLDDIANFIPSRLTALLMVICSMSPRGFAFIIKYGNKHKSPNAGFPEAALAGILNCRLGGPGKYDNVMIYKPYIGKIERTILLKDIKKAVFINHLITLSTVLLISILLFYSII